MWVETIFSREDLTQLLNELLPTKIRLGAPEDDAWLALYDLGEVSLVPNVGLRVACRAKLRWEIAGIGVPITLNALTVLLRPNIVKQQTGDVLSLGCEIEHADLNNVPEFIDEKITDRVNRELAAKQDAFSWDFTTALSRVVALPPHAEPVDAIDVKVAWGKLRIDEDAMVIAISLHAHLLRDTAMPLAVVAAPPRPIARRAPSAAPLYFAAAAAFLSGIAIASMWAGRNG